MITTIVKKELREYSRDGRSLGLVILLVVLVAISLFTGWTSSQSFRADLDAAQQEESETFENQGDKAPHAAAHFGRLAYKPSAPLSMFDPGASAYLGQVIWLEAHNSDPAMFRPAEDASELSRLANLSVAGVLQLLAPLFVIVLGYAAFAGERETGTLRQVVGTGLPFKPQFLGKMLSLLLCVAFVITLVILISVGQAASLEPLLLIDTGVRGVGLAVSYGLYVLTFVCITLFVSARSRNATAALLVLLSIWAVSVVLVPRLAASVANTLYPTPNSEEFWSGTSESIKSLRPEYGSEEYYLLVRKVLGKSLGREVTAEEASKMPLNRMGLNLEISEGIGAQAYAEAYENLFATYQKQAMVRRVIGLFSPSILVAQTSSALVGSDIATHQDYTHQAEKQRLSIISKMNEDMMLKGAGLSFNYLSGAEFWKTLPAFSYSPPAASFAISSAKWDFVSLLIWALFAFICARSAALSQRII